jgi:hypothetical protein
MKAARADGEQPPGTAARAWYRPMVARSADEEHRIPVALFLISVWALQVRPHHLGRWHAALVPTAAVLVLVATLTPEPVLVTGLLVAALVAASVAAAPHAASA